MLILNWHCIACSIFALIVYPWNRDCNFTNKQKFATYLKVLNNNNNNNTYNNNINNNNNNNNNNKNNNNNNIVRTKFLFK